MQPNSCWADYLKIAGQNSALSIKEIRVNLFVHVQWATYANEVKLSSESELEFL